MRDYDESWNDGEPLQLSLRAEIGIALACLLVIGAWIWGIASFVSWCVRLALS